jgi:hypothetical protein
MIFIIQVNCYLPGMAAMIQELKFSPVYIFTMSKLPDLPEYAELLN